MPRITIHGIQQEPHVYRELSLHPLKVCIRCALSQDKIIGLIFFNKTMNIAEYQRIITDFIANLLIEERNGHLQQYSILAHMSVETMSFYSCPNTALRSQQIFLWCTVHWGHIAACTVPVSAGCTLLLQFRRLFSISFAIVSSPLRFYDSGLLKSWIQVALKF